MTDDKNNVKNLIEALELLDEFCVHAKGIIRLGDLSHCNNGLEILKATMHGWLSMKKDMDRFNIKIEKEN